MTAQATLLYQLQTLDLNLAKRRARLKEIATLLGNNQKVAAAQATVTAAENSLKPYQVKGRDLELEVKGVAEKIKTTNDLLYSGKVRNPKEMQDMQEEITSLQKRQSQLEDSLIDTMLHVDEEQTALNAAQATLKQVIATEAGEQVSLHDEQERLTAEVKQIEESRKLAVETVDPVALKKYESMRVAKKGQPVALLQNGSCRLCGVEQTSNIVHKVQQGHELITCLSCGRILTPAP